MDKLQNSLRDHTQHSPMNPKFPHAVSDGRHELRHMLQQQLLAALQVVDTLWDDKAAGCSPCSRRQALNQPDFIHCLRNVLVCCTRKQ